MSPQVVFDSNCRIVGLIDRALSNRSNDVI